MLARGNHEGISEVQRNEELRPQALAVMVLGEVEGTGQRKEGKVGGTES